jgi:hypothetical protein
MSSQTHDTQPRNTTAIRPILKSQYHAALEMLREAITVCPEDTWYSDDPTNAFWQVAYHTLYFTHLYLQQNETAFVPWEHQQSAVQHPDGIPGRADPNSALPLIPKPYSRAEVLAYWKLCDAMVDTAIETLDLDSDESGFSWYRMSKLEHQIVNIRHIQHHAAQLADRLRSSADIGIHWVGSMRGE